MGRRKKAGICALAVLKNGDSRLWPRPRLDSDGWATGSGKGFGAMSGCAKLDYDCLVEEADAALILS